MSNDTVDGRKRFKMANVIYLTALGIIGCLAVGTYVISDSIVQRQRDTASVVNIAGRQRMLSQRIAMLALDISRQDNMLRHGELEKMVRHYADEIERGNNLLNHGSEEKGASERYTLEDYGITDVEHAAIDEHIRLYLQEVRSLLSIPASERIHSSHLELLLGQAREPLLRDLDTAVTRIQEHSEASVAFLRRVMLGTVVLIVATLILEAVFIFRPLFCKLKSVQDALLEAATTDPLTGCMNRRQLMDAAKFELTRSRRYKQPLSAMMLDIDKFKVINDTWGHSTGDEAIIALARTISATIRSSDLFGRLGGDEFVVILPQTNKISALIVAEKLVSVVSGLDIVTAASSFRMTISVGVAIVSDTDTTIIATLDRADKALYCSKKAGRNRVTYLEPGDAPDGAGCPDNATSR